MLFCCDDMVCGSSCVICAQCIVQVVWIAWEVVQGCEYACWTSCESSSYSLWCLDKLNYWEALGKMKTQRAILRLILFLLNLFNSKKDIRNPKLVRCQDLVGMNGLQCTGGFTRAIEWWMSWSLRPHIKSPSLFWNLINSFLCFCHLMYY